MSVVAFRRRFRSFRRDTHELFSGKPVWQFCCLHCELSLVFFAERPQVPFTYACPESKTTPKRSKTSPKTIENDAKTSENDTETIENGAETTENGAETKHLNSTRTARPPKGPGSSSRIQMLKSSFKMFSKTSSFLEMVLSGVVPWIASGDGKKKHLIEAAPFGHLDQIIAEDDRTAPTRTKHLIEAAPFGRLDQMLRTIV